MNCNYCGKEIKVGDSLFSENNFVYCDSVCRDKRYLEDAEKFYNFAKTLQNKNRRKQTMNDFEKCRVCNKKLEPHCATHGFCSPACLQIHKTQGEAKIEKFEEIKQKAWEIILSAGYNSDDDKVRRFISSRTAWNKAERFYDYTKEKEREGERIPSPCDIAAQVFHESLKEKEKNE